MRTRVTLGALAILLGAAAWVAGQDPNGQGMSPPADPPPVMQQPSAYPDQPVVAQDPSLRRRAPEEINDPPQRPTGQGGPQGMAPPNAAGPQPPQPPFVLTPAEEAQLDRLLLFWEQSSQTVKSFRAKFRRFEYNPTWALQNQNPNKPIAEDDGELRYQSPDKGLFSIEQGPRAEKWICDGKSMYQYDFRNKLLREYKLPPEAQGQAIANGPVPFLFGAKAKQLKHRYWLRMTPPPPEAKNEFWLEAQPKFAADAQNFDRVEVILSIGKNDVTPTAVQIYHPGGKSRTAYTLFNITVNQKDMLGIFQDPFTARIPAGWQKIIEENAQTPNAAQPRPGTATPPAAMGSRGVAPR